MTKNELTTLNEVQNKINDLTTQKVRNVILRTSKLDEHKKDIIVMLRNGIRQSVIARAFDIAPSGVRHWMDSRKIKEEL